MSGCYVFGPDIAVIAASPSAIVPGTLNLTLQYTDYVGLTNFTAPLWPCGGPAYGPTAVLSQHPPTFLVSQVPVAETVSLVLQACPTRSACGGGGPPVRGTVTFEAVGLLSMDFSSGATCITVSWVPLDNVYNYYEVMLLTSDGTSQVAVTTVPANITSVTFEDLSPGELYLVQMFGLFADVTLPSVFAGTIGVATELGPNVGSGLEIVSTVVVDESTVTLVLRYEDFTCVAPESLTLEYTNAPPGWPGAVTVLQTDPVVLWQISQVPVSAELALLVTGNTSSECACPVGGGEGGSAVVRVSAVGGRTLAALPTTVSRNMVLQTPSLPEDCASESVPGLVLEAVSDVCATLTWQPNSAFGNGYTWGLLQGRDTTPVQSGTRPFSPAPISVTVAGLTKNTQYTFVVTGTCSDGTNSISSSLTFSTLSCSPFLPEPTRILFTPTSSSSYNVVIPYFGYTCVQTPVLSVLSAKPAVQTLPTPVQGCGPDFPWVVPNVPPNTTLTLKFVSSDQCGGPSRLYEASVQFTAVTPATAPNPCKSASIAVSVSQVSSSGATLTWVPTPAAQFASTYKYNVSINGTVVQSNSSVPSQQAALTGLSPSTTYSVTVFGQCGNAQKASTTGTVSFTTLAANPAPKLPPVDVDGPGFVQYTYVTTTTVVAVLTYGGALNVVPGEVTLQWQDPPQDPVITNTSPTTWTVGALTVGSSYDLVFSAPEADAVPFTLTIPPYPASAVDLFDLHVPMYSMPARIALFVQTGTSEDDPALFGAGDESTPGSYLNQQALHRVFSWYVVNCFIATQLQTPRTLTLNSWTWNSTPTTVTVRGLPIATVYYNVYLDPVAQNAYLPTQTNGFWYAHLNYQFASTDTQYASRGFDKPPILEFFFRMVQYNWAASNGAYPNSRQVQLGVTCYGSKHFGEWWWSNAGFVENPDNAGFYDIRVNGVLTDETNCYPSDPVKQNSVVDGSPNDGNPGSTTVTDTAGWNCMERWFAYCAYLNQCIRQYIAEGNVVYDGAEMRLADVDDGNCKFYQISAITCDAEGNGFPNTLYPETPTSPQGNSTATSAWCNWAIKALWNKWFNQATTAPTPPGPDYPQTPGTWETFAVTSGNAGVGALAPGARGDLTTFTIPCSFSSTTPELVKGMSDADMFSSDFDAIGGVFHEVYDSGTAPAYWLGATGQPTEAFVPGFCGDTSSSAVTSTAGVPFTDDVYAAAHSKAFMQEPDTYLATYGAWDNCVVTAPVCAGALAFNGQQQLISSSTTPGSITAYNSGNLQKPFSALLNTSQYTPWLNNDAVPWLVTPLVTGAGTVTANASSLGWALEGSRYDLYNGFWAANTRWNPSAAVDYSLVAQGKQVTYSAAGKTYTGIVDGGLLWEDLSLGLKPYVGAVMRSMSDNGNTPGPTNGRGQVLMLSVQCGPFNNCQGADAATRQVPGPTSNPNPTSLTFSCPDSALGAAGTGPSSDPTCWPGWPGWYGMNGTYWGPGTAANTGILQPYTLSQINLGPLDPSQFPVLNNSTEDNFGVFADVGVLLAAYVSMAKDMNGTAPGSDGRGIGGVLFGQSAASWPNLGLYELGFVPVSWLNTGATFQSVTPP